MTNRVYYLTFRIVKALSFYMHTPEAPSDKHYTLVSHTYFNVPAVSHPPGINEHKSLNSWIGKALWQQPFFIICKQNKLSYSPSQVPRSETTISSNFQQQTFLVDTHTLHAMLQCHRSISCSQVIQVMVSCLPAQQNALECNILQDKAFWIACRSQLSLKASSYLSVASYSTFHALQLHGMH